MPKPTRVGTEANSLRSAASYISRSAKTMRINSTQLSQHIAECDSLVQWAENYGKVCSFSFVKQFKPVSEGAEHVVYHDHDSARAIKATKTNCFGHSCKYPGRSALPLEYLKRLLWANCFFGDDIRLEAVAYEHGQIEVITSQPWISHHKVNPSPEDSEIRDYFDAFGFAYVPLNPEVPLFYNKSMELIVADAHNQNVIRDEKKRLAVIDVVIGKPSKEMRSDICQSLSESLKQPIGSATEPLT